MRRQEADSKIVGLAGDLRHGPQRIFVAVGQRGDGRLLAGMFSVKASRGKLSPQSPAKHAELSALDERHHGHGQ